jgi:hypothetical protein
MYFTYNLFCVSMNVCIMCHQCATWSPLKKPLRSWRTASGPASGCSILQSAEHEDPGCLRILTRICHSRRTAGPSRLACTTLRIISGGRQKTFMDRVEDPTIKIHLLWGGEKTMNRVCRQILELQAVLPAARPKRNSARTFWGSQSPPTGQRDQNNLCTGAVQDQATSGLTAPA